jgi:hypothetical protein
VASKLILGVLFLQMFAAAAAMAAPTLRAYSRAKWDKEQPAGIPEDLHKTRIVVHHTAFFVSDEEKKLKGKASWEATVAHVRKAQFLHKHIKGWKEIGYHYIIDWNGRILEGRELTRLGAHVEKHNTGSIGVVLLGDFSNQRPTDRQSATLKSLLEYLTARFDIPRQHITGHYEMKSTACPGTYLNYIWDESAKPLDFVQIQPRRGK